MRSVRPPAPSRSSAACERSGISSRRVSRMSTAADSVISGDRSSWLTSDAKRASRSMRSCSACAISLNELASTPRCGSSVASRRVSRRPPAIASGGLAHVGQRAQGAAPGPEADAGARERREHRCAEQRDAERTERALQVVELDDLEVLRVRGLQRDADSERRLALERERHAGGVTLADGCSQRRGDHVLILQRARRTEVPLVRDLAGAAAAWNRSGSATTAGTGPGCASDRDRGARSSRRSRRRRHG